MSEIEFKCKECDGEGSYYVEIDYMEFLEIPCSCNKETPCAK